MKIEKQPAKINYFFGPGWKKLGEFIKKFWNYTKDDVVKRKDAFEEGKGILSIKGMWKFMICFMLILFGTLFFLIISGLVSIIYGVVVLVFYLIFAIVWGIDRLYLVKNKIFVACPSCKGKYLIPTYKCPSCNAKHTQLTPGRYGVFKRECECGNKIPTTFFMGRGQLPAECPGCGYVLKGTENVPICVPIIGGRSAGKTSYITAFCYDFIEKVSKRNDITIEHYSDEMEKFYNNEIMTDYQNGTTRMTLAESDLSQASSKVFDFIMSSEKLSPKRLVQIYDVAGESFVNNTENELQLQYQYCQGIIFMLDPLSIPVIRNASDEQIDEVDKNSLGTADFDLIFDSFMNKIRMITGASDDSVISTPLAIVLSKGDIKTVQEYVGEDVVNKYLDENNMEFGQFVYAQSDVIKEFLSENDLGNFVNTVDMRFKNNMYFVCSAIGHTRDDSSQYNPKGVLEPMEWIFQKADSSMKKVWNEHGFGVKNKEKK